MTPEQKTKALNQLLKLRAHILGQIRCPELELDKTTQEILKKLLDQYVPNEEAQKINDKADSMCDQCKPKAEKKDPRNYISEDVPEFIITFDNYYLRASACLSFGVVKRNEDTYVVTVATCRDEAWIIERFSTEAEAQEFLDDLMERISE